jgi:hypothetical protein
MSRLATSTRETIQFEVSWDDFTFSVAVANIQGQQQRPLDLRTMIAIHNAGGKQERRSRPRYLYRQTGQAP